MQSRMLRTLLLAAPLGLAPLAASADEVNTAAGPPPPPVEYRLPVLGLKADAGLPDGLNAALVYRPWRWVRAEAGGSYNMISPGVRAGLTLIPFGWGPSGTLEAGHYFEGNANGIARKFAGADYKDSALLERIGYDYVNAHLGFEFGVHRMTFFIHGGMSYIRGKLHNADSVVQAETSALLGANSSVSVKQDPIIRAFLPSAKLGLIVYVW
jgi:hypothetical protein